MDLHYPAPFYWNTDEAKKNPGKWLIDSDTCIINDDYFIRGILEIPILDSQDVFIWGIWVTLSRNNFIRYKDLFKAPDVSKEPAYFGWFASRLKGYEDTLNLKTHVHLQNGGLRPKIELEHSHNHLLCIEQQEGITLHRVNEILKINEII